MIQSCRTAKSLRLKEIIRSALSGSPKSRTMQKWLRKWQSTRSSKKFSLIEKF